MDKAILDHGRMVASMVIQHELLPRIRDVLAYDLKVVEERIALFEKCFEDRRSKRLEAITIGELKKKDEEAMRKIDEEEAKKLQEET